MSYRKLAFLVPVVCVSTAMAQVGEVERFEVAGGLAPEASAAAYSKPAARPSRGVIARVDHAGLVARLAGAPAERAGVRLREYGMEIELPHPAAPGGVVRCVVAESGVMEPGLAARFPEISTYIVETAEDGPLSATGRLEISPRGLSGMLRATPGGAEGRRAIDLSGATWMIDPWMTGDPSRLLAYFAGHVPGQQDWVCWTQPGPELAPARESAGAGARAVQSMRTFRLAMACTGEYGVHHSALQGNSPNVADPLAAIVTVVSRSNVVFEQDLAVRFVLVANNDQAIFIDPATDPFPSTCDGSNGADCSSAVLSSLPSVLAGRVGAGTYDTGHCVTRVAGGVAYLRAACGGGVGVSGIPRGGDDDPFSPNVVIHELGHQLGANHTFSGTRGRCGNNANLSTAWEAGSGSSPMAYAGACPVGDAEPSDNIVRYADPFFHSGSLIEMRDYLANNAGCAQVTSTGNNIPEITSITQATVVPPGTPFTLNLQATDADGDALTVSWEQYDSGVRRPISGEGSEDNGQGSLYRICPPVSETSRTFPRMADVLSGVFTRGERFVTAVDTTRRFRAVVRDNRAGGGGVAVSSRVTLTFPAGSTPFALTAPSAGVIRAAGPMRVAWTTGGTQNAPFGASSVLVDLSLDGGATFPIALGTIANTGAGTVTLPAVASADARLRLRPSQGIYFAVSGPFRVAACIADMNADGFIDFFDFDEFVVAFEGGEPLADLTSDGFIDFFDYDAFVSGFESGCN